MTETPPGPPSLARAEIDLGALRHNVALARRLAAGTPVLAAVKADAYGHGMEIVVPELRRAGVEAFGVASAREGARLREMGVSEPILVFGELLPENLDAYVEHDLAATVASPEAVRLASEIGQHLTVHVKVDTGMHRLGIAPPDLAGALERLRSAPQVHVAAVWTHLATSDDEDLAFARRQIELFDEVRAHAGVTGLGSHLANSGALARLPEAVRGRSWVRPGGLLYGLASTGEIARAVTLRPVLSLVARVVQVRAIGRGESVSYGRTWWAESDTRIATIAAGYGDGFPRALSNRGQVAIGARRFPIAGRVCMDMLMVDLGPPGGPGRHVSRGDEAILFGRDGPSTLDQATAGGLLSYELTTGLTQRVARIALDDDLDGGRYDSFSARMEEPR